MLCDNCHSSNAPGARFCSICGSPLPDQALVHKQEQELGREYGDSGYSYDDGFSGRKEDYSGGQVNRQNDYEYYQGQNGGYGQYQYNNNQYNNQYGGNQYYADNRYGNSQYYGGQNGYQGYGIQQKPSRSVGAIVVYMISGTLALITMAMAFLPNIDLWGGVNYGSAAGNRYWNVLQYIGETFKYNGSYQTDAILVGIILISLFAIPMIFQLLWAIFSFARVRAAGVMGLIGSIVYSSSTSYWLLYLLNVIPIGRFYYTGSTRYEMDTTKYITAAPYIMVALSVAGIVFSVIQIAKRSRVR